MSSYLVLARKWRPQKFADLVGQAHISQTLTNAIAQNRVAHAFLFTGSRGVGKTTTARLFAKALNCVDLRDGEPCNACAACGEITEGRSMDVIEIDGASNRGINEIRELREAVRYAPTRDRYKIYIIDEVHMLTTEAFNALLKTLEEPPPHAIFIFATTDANKIPVTILSRCQRYDFKRIQIRDLVAHLQKIAKAEGIEFEDAALQLIARNARGGVRDALSAMDQIIAFAPPPISSEKAAEILGVASRETLISMAQALLRSDVNAAIEALALVDRYGQSLSQFAFDLLEFLRDITVIAASANAKSDLVELSVLEREAMAPYIEKQNMERLQRLFSLWYECSELIPRSLSPKLLMEMTLVKMCQTQAVMPLGNIMHRLDALAKGLMQNAEIPSDAFERAQNYLKQTLPVIAVASTPDSASSEQVDAKKKPELATAENKSAATEATATETIAEEIPTKKNENPLQEIADEVVDRKSAEDDALKEDLSSHEKQESAEKSAIDKAQIPNASDLSQENAASDALIGAACERNRYMTQEAEDDDYNDFLQAQLEDLSQKQFAVSPASAHNAGALPNDWEVFVRQLPTILCAIMEQAVMQRFDAQELRIELPRVFAPIVNNEYRVLTLEALKDFWGAEPKLTIEYKELAEGAESLAAMRKLKELEQHKAKIAEIRQSSVIKEAIAIFEADPQKLRICHKPKDNV
ncbi:MAG: DNA polymerase III subunit gamma/tau [Bradymonadales bacterium]|jgi:DNA polymerase-3 subunit gamma/tau